jgi:hypothetical protein
MTTRTPEPSACRHCGVPKREHFRRWSAEAKWHPHAEPTQEQIKERMLARRAVRQQAAVKRIEDRLWARMQQVIHDDLGKGHRGNVRSAVDYAPTDDGASASCTYGLWNQDGTTTEYAIAATFQAGVIAVDVQRTEDSFDGVWGPGGSFTMDGPDELVVIDHTVYKIGPEHGRSGSGFRGFCGRRFDIEFLDGRTVTTTNLWEAKTVPPKWRDRWPDTARWAARDDAAVKVEPEGVAW